MAQSLAIELAASALVSASGQGSAVDIGALRRAARLAIHVTAFTPVDDDPDPSVLLTFEARANSSLPWRSVDTLSVAAAGAYNLALGGLDRYLRVTWTLVNMTSAQFAVAGEAHVVYCDPSDRGGVPESAFDGISASERAENCILATADAEGYVNSAYTLPLTAWDDSLRQKTAQLATAKAFRDRGCDPAGADKVVFDAEAWALKWFDRLADGLIKPPGILDSTPTVFEGGSVVVSGPRRNW